MKQVLLTIVFTAIFSLLFPPPIPIIAALLLVFVAPKMRK